MGVLRLLLALSVVIDHQSEGAIKFGPGGESSVQCFYIISGFYISLVLDRTYRSNVLFWANRGLRLFPSYWVVAAVSLLFLPPYPPDVWAKFLTLPNMDRVFVAFSNVALVGQDWFLFLGFRHGHLLWVKYFTDSDFPIYQLLVVPPAWSLGVELSFYAVAPFILRKGWGVLSGCLVASLVLRVILINLGLSGDPWSYRFFPNELATFLTGCAAYRIYRAVLPTLSERLGLCRMITVGALAVIACTGPLAPADDRRLLFPLAVVALTLPFAAVASRTNRVDRFLGNLSYPIYICHWLGMRLVNQYMKLPQLAAKVALTVAVVVLIALALELCVDQPVERLRARLRERSRDKRAPGGACAPVLEAQP